MLHLTKRNTVRKAAASELLHISQHINERDLAGLTQRTGIIMFQCFSAVGLFSGHLPNKYDEYRFVIAIPDKSIISVVSYHVSINDRPISFGKKVEATSTPA